MEVFEPLNHNKGQIWFLFFYSHYGPSKVHMSFKHSKCHVSSQFSQSKQFSLSQSKVGQITFCKTIAGCHHRVIHFSSSSAKTNKFKRRFLHKTTSLRNGLVLRDPQLHQIHPDQTNSLSGHYSRSVQSQISITPKLSFFNAIFFYVPIWFNCSLKIIDTLLLKMYFFFHVWMWFLGLIVSSALIIWKGLMCLTGGESPVVVVLSESMEPGFARVSFYLLISWIKTFFFFSLIDCAQKIDSFLGSKALWDWFSYNMHKTNVLFLGRF